MDIHTIFPIRFFPKFRKEPYLFWYKLLGYYPKQLTYYNLALCHKSANIHNDKGERLTNERLEFLGDAVLGAVVTNILYCKYPTQEEGFLSNARAKIVCRDSLNKLAKRLELDKRIQKASNIAEDVENIYGNALEALIGAIYLDKGYDMCYNFVSNNIMHYGFINLDKVVKKETDFKSRLLEWAQRHQKKLSFELIDEQILDGTNKHLFRYQVCVDGASVAVATGKTKREAQQHVAETALRQLRKKESETI